MFENQLHKIQADSDSRTMELLDLPPEVREQIWSKLPNADLRVLRRVCSVTKQDVDYLVGIYASLKNDPTCVDWLRKVTLRSFIVEKVVVPIPWDFFAKPTLLRSLFIQPEPISSTNLATLLAETSQLRTITIQIQEGPGSLAVQNKEYSDVIINGLRNKAHLKEFILTMPPFTLSSTSATSESLHYKDLEFPRQEKVCSFIEFPRQLKTIVVVAPFVHAEDLVKWKAFFDAQIVLDSLVCFMGKVHWALYSSMIQTSAPTLRCLVLQDVQSFRPGAELFDWAILTNCPNLETLYLNTALDSRGIDSKYLESVNFGRLALTRLKDVRLMFVLLAEPDLARLLIMAPSLKDIDLQFFRRELNYYPILGFLGGILSRRHVFQKVFIADLQRIMFHEEELGEDLVQEAYGSLQHYDHELNRYRNGPNTLNFVPISVHPKPPVVVPATNVHQH